MSLNADLSSYGVDEHRHRFAVWTASRAVQRGYLKTQQIQKAIETAHLRENMNP